MDVNKEEELNDTNIIFKSFFSPSIKNILKYKKKHLIIFLHLILCY